MLEVYIVYKLATSNVKKAQMKGHTGWVFGLITVLLWIFFEIGGAIIGAITGGTEGLALYLFALVGAAIGGLLSYVIVLSLPNKVVAPGNLQPNQYATGPEPQFYKTPIQNQTPQPQGQPVQPPHGNNPPAGN